MSRFEEYEKKKLTQNQKIYIEIDGRYEKCRDRLEECEDIGSESMIKMAHRVVMRIDLEARRN